MGCVGGRVVRRVGGRAPTPTQLVNTSHQSFTRIKRALSCEASVASLVLENHWVVTRLYSDARVAWCCFSVRLFIACFLRAWLTSTPTKWGVWKGELSGVVGGRAPAPTQSRFTPRIHTTIQLSLHSWIAGTSFGSPSGCLERGFDFFRPMTHTTHVQAT